jgi:hypothetical protein
VAQFRCYLLNQAGAIAAAEVIECDSDLEAIQRAEALMQEREAAAVELWHLARRIHVAKRVTTP